MFWRGRVHVLRSYPLQTPLVLGCLEVHLWKLNPFEQCQENSESLFGVNNVKFKKSGSLPVLWQLCLLSPLELQWGLCFSECVIRALGILYSRGSPTSKSWVLLHPSLAHWFWNNPQSAYETQAVPVTTAYSRSCLKIKSKEFALLSFL